MKIEYWCCEGWRPIVNGLMDRRGYMFLWRARVLGLLIRLGIARVQPFPSVPWFTSADLARFREHKERIGRSMKIEPVAFVWDGAAMIPLERFRALASRQFRPGTEYALVPHQGRSEKAHGLYFKAVEVGWKNLPHGVAERFPTSEHFRKWCLIQEGIADEHTMLCDNEPKARATAALCRTLDGYAVIKVNGPIVTVWTAKSQSHHAMGHDAFNASMNKVLERIAEMLGITVTELTENAKSEMTREIA